MEIVVTQGQRDGTESRAIIAFCFKGWPGRPIFLDCAWHPNTSNPPIT
jgi:hypothetical protein